MNKNKICFAAEDEVRACNGDHNKVAKRMGISSKDLKDLIGGRLEKDDVFKKVETYQNRRTRENSKSDN